MLDTLVLDVEVFEKPIEVKGHLSLWDYDLQKNKISILKRNIVIFHNYNKNVIKYYKNVAFYYKREYNILEKE